MGCAAGGSRKLYTGGVGVVGVELLADHIVGQPVNDLTNTFGVEVNHADVLDDCLHHLGLHCTLIQLVL